jgi:hypothetical protein
VSANDEINSTSLLQFSPSDVSEETQISRHESTTESKAQTKANRDDKRHMMSRLALALETAPSHRSHPLVGELSRATDEL